MIKYLLIFTFFNSIIFSQDDLKLNLNIGEEYLLYQHNEISMIQYINGSKVRMYFETDALNSYYAKTKTDSSIILEVTMRDMIFMMSSPYMNIYYNSKEVSTNENILVKLLRKLNGHKFDIEMSYSGKVISTDFNEVILPSILSFLDSLDIPNKEIILNEMSEKIVQMSPAKNLEMITNFLPSKNVQLGEKWTTNGTIEFGIPIIYKREILYKSKTEDSIILESSSSINTYELDPSKKLPENITYNITGNEKYELNLSPETRWFNKIEGESNLKGNTYQINGSDTLNIPMSMNVKEYYGVEKY
jgi:hypothetical protein